MTAQCEDRYICAVLASEDRDRLGRWRVSSRDPKVRRKQCSSVSPDLHTFNRLVKSWHDQTWHVSSIKRRTAHPDYLKIIGMGMPAVPWILQELREVPDYWFTALEAITRDDPAPQAESLNELRDAWLAWGERLGY